MLKSHKATPCRSTYTLSRSRLKNFSKNSLTDNKHHNASWLQIYFHIKNRHIGDNASWLQSKLHKFRPLGDFLSSENCPKKFWSDYFQQIKFLKCKKIVIVSPNSLIFNAL